MTKTITLSSWQICLVEVPESLNIFEVRPVHSLLCGKERKEQRYWDTYDLPPGQWQIVGITPLTEKQAGEVVEKHPGRTKIKAFMDYEYPDSGMWTALESFASLLKAHSIDSSKRWAVLKTDKN